MPPVKNHPRSTAVAARKPISTRVQKPALLGNNGESANATISGKRKANASPLRNDKAKQPRTALQNVTNAALRSNGNIDVARKGAANVVPAKIDTNQKFESEKAATQATSNILETIDENHGSKITQPRPTKIQTRASSRQSKENDDGKNGRGIGSTAVKPANKGEPFKDQNGDSDASAMQKTDGASKTRRLSLEIEQLQIDQSIYMSAHEDL